MAIQQLGDDRNKIDWDAIAQSFAPGLTAQSTVQAQLLPLLFKANLEKQARQEERDYAAARQESLLNKFINGGNGPQGKFKIKINKDGEISYDQMTADEMQKEEMAGRSSGLAKVLPYMQASAMSGAGPNIMREATAKYNVPEEVKAIMSAYEQGIKQKPKVSQAKDKRAVEIGELGLQAQGLIDLFRNAQGEARKQDPEFGKVGIPGRIAGAGISLTARMGEGAMPSVNVYNRKKKAFATVVAKAAGEVRPTDEDIKRFMGTLPDFSISDQENEMVIQQLMNDINSKGFKGVWTERKSGQGGIPDGYKMQINKKTGATRLIKR